MQTEGLEVLYPGGNDEPGRGELCVSGVPSVLVGGHRKVSEAENGGIWWSQMWKLH